MIAPMSRVEIVCLSEVRAALVSFLQKNGLLHLESSPTDVADEEAVLDRVQFDGEEQEALRTLEDLDRTLNEVTSLLSIAPTADATSEAAQHVAGWTEEEWSTKSEGWIEQLRSATREKVRNQDALDVLNNYRQVLEDVAPALGSDVRLGSGSRALVITGKVDIVATRLRDRFHDEIGSEAQFHSSKISRKRAVGLVTFPPERNEEVSRILSQEGVAPVTTDSSADEDATINEVLAKVRDAIGGHTSAVKDANATIDTISREGGARLVALRVLVTDRLSQFRVQNQFTRGEMFTVISGWTPTESFRDLESALEKEFPGQVEVRSVAADDVPHHHIPTKLSNPGFFKPFELVLKIFNPPTYGTIDPTVMIGVAFLLFYGFIVGDFVYGVVIAGAAWFLGSRFPNNEIIQDASKIGIYMGTSAAIFGILYGEYLGEIFGIPDVWFHRGHDTQTLLKYAIYIGLFHIILSLCIGVYENYKHNHMSHAMEKLGMLLGLLALIGFVMRNLEVGPFTADALLYAYGAMFVVGSVLILRAMGPLMGGVGIIEIISLGGNIMSYARLMALGVAAIAIANMANGMPEQMGPAIGIPLAIIIHTFNIVLSMASPLIHSMRLNVVEFLPKFYTPEGIGYTPFKKETKS